jgi:hypothetical protein
LCCVLGDVDDGGEVHKEGGGGSDVQWLMISVSFQVGSWVSICLVLEFSGLFGDHAMSCAISSKCCIWWWQQPIIFAFAIGC